LKKISKTKIYSLKKIGRPLANMKKRERLKYITIRNKSRNIATCVSEIKRIGVCEKLYANKFDTISVN
jgi:hypothetical protein